MKLSKMKWKVCVLNLDFHNPVAVWHAWTNDIRIECNKAYKTKLPAKL